MKNLFKNKRDMVCVVMCLIIVLTFILLIIHMNKTHEGFQSGSNGFNPAQNEVIIVLFFADWCGHCKKFKPDWEKAVNKLNNTTNNNNKKVSLKEVDCSNGSELATKYGVEGFPTVKVFKNGKEPEDYSGARTFAGLNAFVNDL